MRKLFIWVLFVSISTGVCRGQINLTDSIVHQSYQRKYMVHLPAGYTHAAAWPLVLNLHGGSGNMVNAQGFSLMNPVADQNGFIVAWPQGYGIAPPGFSWADGRNTSADQAGIDDVGFIDKLLDRLIDDFNIDTNRIYICGFSNGGFMVQRIACELPGRFAAMASLGASMDTVRYKTCKPSKPVPMAFFNGTADPAMPYGGGAMQNPLVVPVVPVDTAVRFWVLHNNCQNANPVFDFPDTFTADNSTAQLFTFTHCDCNADVTFYKLINGGHTWPGVFVASQAAALGNTNRDINASTELWNFFSAHVLCNTVVGTDEKSNQPTLLIYPNPATTVLNISISAPEKIKISIKNTLGQTIYAADNQTQVDISNLAGGLYLITVQQGQTHLTQKFYKYSGQR